MKLPNELIDHIFSFLSSKPSLASCSLVCPMWTDAAHRYLFRKLVYVRGKWDIPDVPALLRFLEDTPSVAKHVRILDLEGGCDQMMSYWADVEPDVFASLLEALPNVEHVIMDVVIFSGCSSDDEDEDNGEDKDRNMDTKLMTFGGSGRHLKSLKIGRTSIEGGNPFYTLSRLLQPIESLHTLQVSGLSYLPDQRSVVSLREYCSGLVLPSHLGIQKFVWKFESTVAIVFLETLRQASPCTLRHFDFSYFTHSDWENMTWVVQDFLNDVGAGLETLSIALTGAHDKYLDLSSCKSLQTVTFYHDTAARASDNLPLCFNTMLNTLSTAPHIPFKLSIRFGYFYLGKIAQHARVLSELDWKKLVEIVRLHPCKEKKVTVIFWGSRTFSYFDDVEQIARKKLAGLDAKGWLEVVRRFS